MGGGFAGAGPGAGFRTAVVAGGLELAVLVAVGVRGSGVRTSDVGPHDTIMSSSHTTSALQKDSTDHEHRMGRQNSLARCGKQAGRGALGQDPPGALNRANYS